MDDYERWRLQTLRRSLAMIHATQATIELKIEEVARIIRDRYRGCSQQLDDARAAP